MCNFDQATIDRLVLSLLVSFWVSVGPVKHAIENIGIEYIYKQPQVRSSSMPLNLILPSFVLFQITFSDLVEACFSHCTHTLSFFPIFPKKSSPQR